MSDNFIPLSEPSFQGREKELVNKAIDTTWVSSGGAYVNQFEDDIASYVDSKYAIATSNGTAALHTALIDAGISENHEVIVPTVTFISPINTVRYVNANPIFMDCDEYLNIDIVKLKDFLEKECKFSKGDLINKKSGRIIKAIIPVHIFGHPVNIAKIMFLAEKFNLVVIEDATESLGSYYVKGKFKDKMTGTIGHYGCYSFNGNKLVTTGGGGMIVTDDKEKAEHMKYLTTQAKDDPQKYIHNEVGYNYRMTNLQAALGIAQLENIKKYINLKRKNFQKYKNKIDTLEGLELISEPDYGYSNYWLYSLIVKNSYNLTRNELLKKFANCNISVRPLWYLNHLQKPFSKFQNYKIEKAFYFHKHVLNLPCSINIKDDEIERVLKVLEKEV